MNTVLVVLVVLAVLALARGGRETYVNINTDLISRFLGRYAKTSGGTRAEGEDWLRWDRAISGEGSMFRVFQGRSDAHLVRQAVTRTMREYPGAKILRVDYLIDERSVAFIARNNFVYVRFETGPRARGELLFFAKHNPTGSSSVTIGSRMISTEKTLVPVGLNLSPPNEPWVRD